jgi:hypothetical protein
MLIKHYYMAVLIFLCGIHSALPSSTPSVKPKDVNISISADSFNSASKVYTKAGIFQHSGSLDITTKQLKDVIPKAYKACPDCPILYHAFATLASPPVVSMSEKNGALVRMSNVIVNITTRPSTTKVTPLSVSIPLFVLSVEGSGGVKFSNKPSSSGDYIKLLLTFGRIDIAVITSSVGPIPTIALPVLNPLIMKILQIAATTFNTLFPGFPLPQLTGFNISNLLINTMNDRISISLNITPTKDREKLVIIPLLKKRLQQLPPGFSGPGFSAIVGEKGLNKVLQSMLPKLIKKVNNMTLPALSGIAKGITYETDPIKIRNFNIGDYTINIVNNEGIQLQLTNITLNIPLTKFKLSKKIIIITAHCSGEMSGNITNTSLKSILNITSNNTLPNIMINTTWLWGPLQINEKMDSSVCKVIQDIASFFVGNINQFISKEMKEMIPNTVDNMITNDGNQILNELLLTKKIDNIANVNFYLTSSPLSNNDTVEIDLSGEFVQSTL